MAAGLAHTLPELSLGEPSTQRWRMPGMLLGPPAAATPNAGSAHVDEFDAMTNGINEVKGLQLFKL